jgi:hypothetical protein
MPKEKNAPTEKNMIYHFFTRSIRAKYRFFGSGHASVTAGVVNVMSQFEREEPWLSGHR